MRFFLQWPNQHKGIKNLRKVAELIQPGRILESKGMRAIFHKKGKKRAKKVKKGQKRAKYLKIWG